MSSGGIMANKYRLKIIYKDINEVFDIEQDKSFEDLSDIINTMVGIKKYHDYTFLKGKTVLAANNLDTRFWQLAGNLKLEDKLLYTVSDNKRAYSIKVIVWDYIIESDNKTMEKFIQMAKHLEAIKPKQKYYLSVKKQNFIDKALYDCYGVLKDLDFSGIYNFHLLKNNENYSVVKLIYYILDDKYELWIYNNLDDKENDDYEYLITFYREDRAYFKGYQGSHRNIFVLHRDNTLKNGDFENVFNVLNRITYMLTTVDSDILFKNHENFLVYDFVTEQVLK